jgi:hypothetical protein
MDKSIPFSSKMAVPGLTSLSLLPPGFKDGQTALIGKVFSTGSYMVTFRDGTQVKVKGPDGLQMGVPVRVFRSMSDSSRAAQDRFAVNAWLLESEAVLALKTAFPLAFGGKEAKAKIEIYIPKEKGRATKKKVIYFIITLTTERFGDLQWSIHLWGKDAEVQLYNGLKSEEEDIKKLIRDVEDSFRKAGFRLAGSVYRLEKFFRVPQGYRLDWKV